MFLFLGSSCIVRTWLGGSLRLSGPTSDSRCFARKVFENETAELRVALFDSGSGIIWQCALEPKHFQ